MSKKPHPCDCLSCKIAVILNEHFGGGDGVPTDNHEEALAALADVAGILLSAGDQERFLGFVERARQSANHTYRQRAIEGLMAAFGFARQDFRN